MPIDTARRTLNCNSNISSCDVQFLGIKIIQSHLVRKSENLILDKGATHLKRPDKNKTQRSFFSDGAMVRRISWTMSSAGAELMEKPELTQLVSPVQNAQSY